MQLHQEESISTSEKTSGDETRVRLKGHKLSVTCVCVDSKDRHVYTGSKDGTILKWCLETRKILGRINPLYKKDQKLSHPPKHHTKHVNCLAISSDDKFLASGGTDKYILIWSPQDLAWLHTFTLHKHSITALVFRPGYNTLFSGSEDRSVMLWTLEDDDNRSFVESFHGHESAITDMDVSRKERVLTSGGRDQSIRIWKIAEQAQTVFESSHQSVDSVRFIDDKTFVSGGEDGTISIWSTMKRTPVFSLPNAHKQTRADCDDSLNFDQKSLPSWITALATYTLRDPQTNSTKKRKLDEEDDANEDVPMSDNESDAEEETRSKKSVIALLASGSCSSKIHIWKLLKSGSKYELQLLQSMECPGFINGLRFTSDCSKLVVACGQEHKLGRWWKVKDSKNCLRVFDILEFSSKFVH